MITFISSLPGLFLPLSVNWLRLTGWLSVACAVFSLALGMTVWVDTLAERATGSEMWNDAGPIVQSLLQQKVYLRPSWIEFNLGVLLQLANKPIIWSSSNAAATCRAHRLYLLMTAFARTPWSLRRYSLVSALLLPWRTHFSTLSLRLLSDWWLWTLVCWCARPWLSRRETSSDGTGELMLRGGSVPFDLAVKEVATSCCGYHPPPFQGHNISSMGYNIRIIGDHRDGKLRWIMLR